MTRAEALKRLQKMFGKRYAYRVSERCSSPEERQAAMEEIRAARTRQDEIDREIKERLAALDWYQALLAEKRQLTERRNDAMGRAHHYKFSVGRVDEILGAFHVKGEGDTWEQAFEAAEAKK